MTRGLQKLLDGSAVLISAVCAIHCLGLPLLLLLTPALGATVLTDEAFHAVLLWFILPTSIVAVGLASLRHRDTAVLLLVGSGLGLLIAAVWAHDAAPAWADTGLSITGGAILAMGHIRNFRICRTD